MEFTDDDVDKINARKIDIDDDQNAIDVAIKHRNTIEKRKEEALRYSYITPQMIIGATALRAFASIDDAFDDNGNFDIKKARRTGAIHLIKKIERNKYGFKVEFYDNANAQDKLGNYLGMENAPKNQDHSQSLRQGIEEVAKAISGRSEPLFTDMRDAWLRVRDWAMKKGALYSPDTIAELDKEFQFIPQSTNEQIIDITPVSQIDDSVSDIGPGNKESEEFAK